MLSKSEEEEEREREKDIYIEDYLPNLEKTVHTWKPYDFEKAITEENKGINLILSQELISKKKSQTTH